MRHIQKHGPLTLGLSHPIGERVTRLRQPKTGLCSGVVAVIFMSVALGASADVRVVGDSGPETSTAATLPAIGAANDTAAIEAQPVTDIKIAQVRAIQPFTPVSKGLSRRDMWPSKTVFSPAEISNAKAVQYRYEGEAGFHDPSVASIQYDSDLEVYLRKADSSLPAESWRQGVPLIEKAKSCAVYSETSSDLRRDKVRLPETALGLPAGDYHVLCIPGSADAKQAFADINWSP